ncbi:hypothetical protein HDU76_010218, partial [Blyttiomyces sp. JEL0837]
MTEWTTSTISNVNTSSSKNNNSKGSKYHPSPALTNFDSSITNNNNNNNNWTDYFPHDQYKSRPQHHHHQSYPSEEPDNLKTLTPSTDSPNSSAMFPDQPPPPPQQQQHPGPRGYMSGNGVGMGPRYDIHIRDQHVATLRHHHSNAHQQQYPHSSYNNGPYNNNMDPSSYPPPPPPHARFGPSGHHHDHNHHPGYPSHGGPGYWNEPRRVGPGPGDMDGIRNGGGDEKMNGDLRGPNGNGNGRWPSDAPGFDDRFERPYYQAGGMSMGIAEREAGVGLGGFKSIGEDSAYGSRPSIATGSGSSGDNGSVGSNGNGNGNNGAGRSPPNAVPTTMPYPDPPIAIPSGGPGLPAGAASSARQSPRGVNNSRFQGYPDLSSYGISGKTLSLNGGAGTRESLSPPGSDGATRSESGVGMPGGRISGNNRGWEEMSGNPTPPVVPTTSMSASSAVAAPYGLPPQQQQQGMVTSNPQPSSRSPPSNKSPAVAQLGSGPAQPPTPPAYLRGGYGIYGPPPAGGPEYMPDYHYPPHPRPNDQAAMHRHHQQHNHPHPYRRPPLPGGGPGMMPPYDEPPYASEDRSRPWPPPQRVPYHPDDDRVRGPGDANIPTGRRSSVSPPLQGPPQPPLHPGYSHLGPPPPLQSMNATPPRMMDMMGPFPPGPPHRRISGPSSESIPPPMGPMPPMPPHLHSPFGEHGIPPPGAMSMGMGWDHHHYHHHPHHPQHRPLPRDFEGGRDSGKDDEPARKRLKESLSQDDRSRSPVKDKEREKERGGDRKDKVGKDKNGNSVNGGGKQQTTSTSSSGKPTSTSSSPSKADATATTTDNKSSSSSKSKPTKPTTSSTTTITKPAKPVVKRLGGYQGPGIGVISSITGGFSSGNSGGGGGGKGTFQGSIGDIVAASAARPLVGVAADDTSFEEMLEGYATEVSKRKAVDEMIEK